ncbi:MAG: sodium/glutamate symporter [Deltaproteobacteria bacterium]|nr:sodium/glutamate symporter [Deltaproteobacteria bacterium]
MAIDLQTVDVLILSILVLWTGQGITKRIDVLRRFSIPIAVTGGILASAVVAGLDLLAGVQVSFDLSVRDTLLLVFFSTIGLSAKLATLRDGGRTLAILGGVTLAFLFCQNAIGVSIASLLGANPAYGLLGGSISLAGGHGTAITWGAMAEEAGIDGATTLGLAFATFGLICGGLAGGPVGQWLISRHGLSGGSQSGDASEDGPEAVAADEAPVSVTSQQVIRTILFLAICVAIGGHLNELLRARGTVLPGFLTAMGVGILLTNVSDARGQPVDENAVDLLGNVALHLFLAMSLMSIQLTQLAGSFGAVALVLVAQVVLAVTFATQVVFRLCGSDYDAAVIAAGYTGLGLGATPVGVANMNAVTSRFGPSAKAFLVVPLVGAFLLDILNAGVIQAYIAFFR